MRNSIAYKIVIAIMFVALLAGNIFAYPFKNPRSNVHVYYPEKGGYYIDEKGRAIIRIGEITHHKLYIEMRNLINRLVKNGVKEIILDLNSPGGDEETTSIISIYLDLLKQNGTKITTYVAPGNQCNSGCTVLFIHGDRRIAAEDSIFAFHYGSTGESNIPGLAAQLFEEMDKYHANLIVYRRIFELCGINGQLSKNVMDKHNELYIYKGKELKNVCPNYVTEFIEPKKK